MLHSSCLSGLASISSSVTRMIKTSLKHLSQGQNMRGAGGWSGGVQAKKETEPTLLFLFY